MEDLVKLERKVQSIYDNDLLPLAERFQFELPTSGREAARRPCVLFLGNHSSGKSSFINFLLEDNLQKTGLAPTDDGFTIISYGQEKDELDGQSVVTHPDLGFRMLRRLGPDFFARLRLKTHPHPLLQSLTLIDSPGMIDASASANARGYDFEASVRMFAEAADLILFYFDPDKPGTTGETISMFTHTLAGMDHKLLIIINKMDSFFNIRDFARTYGTLCWNLSKLIKTKDVPQFFTTYIPGADPTLETDHKRSIPLEDFDDSREEVVHEIKRAPVRRADNLVSDLYNNVCRLSMLGRVCSEIGRRYRSLRFKAWLVAIIILIIGGFVALAGFEPWGWMASVGIVAGTLLVSASVIFVGGVLLERMRTSYADPDRVTLVFNEIYRTPLAMGDRADLRGTWNQIRKRVMDTLSVLGIENLPRPHTVRRSTRRLDEVLEQEIPKMRRKIAGASAETPATPTEEKEGNR